MHHVIEFDQECPSYKGTGLYQGMGESPKAAVVCHMCEGSGCKHTKIEYDDFVERKKRDGVVRVYRTNPGIKIGEGNGHKLEDFGGMPYEDWLEGESFYPGTEDRQHTCPAWFYQSADSSKKPDWKECGWGMFSDCKHFPCKSECWKRWDKEFGNE